ncbi:PE-PPE domain-containing protein [[Mycobacterium] crassicus]|uniref:PE-PPE domain-containing protein n=1 Tax=[Mycobacterium] crassicus TaxID=2872309 RepID=A0ABU5XLD3_9MYCO|nr:PE-PPE domain-containing protein [Mycolicibacter sp. MYC098]MEB3023093.1 PE-PPE domain-containing protein [Mycolicibacter sp. MYC098]
MKYKHARRTGSGLLSAVTATALLVPAAQAAAGPEVTAALAVSPAALPAFPYGGPPGDPYACMAADVFGCSIVFGGSGIPIPHQNYIDAVNERYIQPLYPGFTPQALFTPEGLQPFTGVKNLPLDVSMAQGLTMLQLAVDKQFELGHEVNLYGYSQSASIDTLLMRQYLALPADQRPDADQLTFTFLGNPNTPNGGLMQVFNLPEFGGSVPIASLGLTLNGATPDGPWATNNYTLEYDGFADFPRYPLNLLSSLNAMAGILYTHIQYPMLPMTPDGHVANAILLPGSVDYVGELPDGVTASTATNYWMIPTENLPLLEPFRGSPFGNAIADLVQPSLRVLVNLGYGQIEHGWDAGPANVPTTIGLFPDVNPMDVWTALANGAQQGWQDFVQDLGSLSSAVADGPDTGVDIAAFTMPSLIEIANAFSGSVSAINGAMMVTGDILNALTTTLPAAMAQVFFSELSQGNLLDAIGLPLAAASGLGALAAGFELVGIMHATSQIQAEWAGLFG